MALRLDDFTRCTHNTRMLSRTVPLTETEALTDLSKVESIIIHEHEPGIFSVELVHSAYRDPVIIVTDRESQRADKTNCRPKLYYNRERMLKRLARLFPTIETVTLLQMRPIEDISLTAYR